MKVIFKSSKRFLNIQASNNSLSYITKETVENKSSLLKPNSNDFINPNSDNQKVINPFDEIPSRNNLLCNLAESDIEKSFPNLQMNIPQDLLMHLQSIVSNFSNVSKCFGYGSGVFPQATKSQSKNQIDLLISVNSPLDWHKSNIKKFPHHYSSMKYVINIPSIFEKIQGLGAGVYFNPFTQINGSEVKYGVMSNKTLLTDLQSWNTFYLAGRLQKPVMDLTPANTHNKSFDLEVSYWLERNLIAASVLAKKRSIAKYGTKFSDFQFFTELCTLSYLGDIRFKLGGENPDKCANIVKKNLENFHLLYDNILNEVMIMDDSVAETYLPIGFTFNNYEDKLEQIIGRSSLEQAVKGVFTAGVWKSYKYAWAKKMKAMKK